MKKLFLILTAIVVNVGATFAQDTFVATLEHNGEYTNFYNTQALSKAHDAAEDGDIITLSAGAFSCPTITKGVTIRGIGLGHGQKHTTITTAVDVYAQDTSRTVNLEGLYFNTTLNIYSDGGAESAGRVNLIKSRCNAVNVLEKDSATEATTVKVSFYNCWLHGEFKSNSTNFTDVKILNSYISGRCYTNISNVSNTMFRNCYLNFNNLNSMQNSALENCIIRYSGDIGDREESRLPASASAINSISFTNNRNYDFYYDHSAFEIISYAQNCSYLGPGLDLNTVFSDKANFILQEEFAKTYLGTDGKEVGMHGGIGYTTKVRYPVISTLSIGNDEKTTREGKLDVTIELDRE